MASRRDELNGYTFAKKRLVAAFLQPSPDRTDEGAPNPLRAVLPGLVIAALVLAGFGAWGMFRPKAPKGWDTPGQHVIVGSKSATLYVVLNTGGKRQLHPVLNMASARLLLKTDRFDLLKVDESELDSGKIPHGPTLGIPYAPDRIPEAQEAERSKRWAVCEQPGSNGRSVQKATFLLADRDAGKVDGPGRLSGGQVLYVQETGGTEAARYLIDAKGTKYLIDGGRDTELLLRALVGSRQPQQVTKDWLATFHDGTPIAFPDLPGTVGEPAGIQGLAARENRVGVILRATTGAGAQQYAVLRGKVVPVSDFVARLLLFSKQTAPLEQRNRPTEVDAQSFTPETGSLFAEKQWPQAVAEQANATTAGGEGGTVCSVLRSVSRTGGTELSTWAGTSYPQQIVNGGTSAYVTPGTGLFYKQIQAGDVDSGAHFLVTDTGLRYGVQTNNDSSAKQSGIGADGEDKDGSQGSGQGPGEGPEAGPGSGPGPGKQQESHQAQILLGYKDIKPALVPASWSKFLPMGPRLDTNAARQPQGS
ncbi:type VII secretion protein EccB [Streptomyces sp. MST-110588]|uniref:type VII secretion protein EccB n=1 Tax=Streptomyces sp. MST-110588 TaxID=2833628 RepID=UPI001F5D52E9|nr:type VII secretion protein EccB [Streptomyces sp. MST-110588]UNO41067.1 type VII secretion protein EccB [Streptomyces sp. MST-110588]